jgi:transcriptional regulator with XRE-family HTH domain
MTDFGTLLRIIRNRCIDPYFPGRRLSQERLGELLGKELGMQAGFSGAAVSDWERGKSKIHADNRRVLISLLFILRVGGGIATIADANEFLEVGNYRALNPAEIEKVFPDKREPVDSRSQQETFQSPTPFSFEELFFISNQELRTSLAKAKAGPEPAWPRMIVAMLRSFLDQWTILHSLKALLWFWIWLFAWGLMAPSLHWPFSSREDAISVLRLYVGGTIAIPPLIGLLTDTKNNAFWQQLNLATAVMTRLYTHQGAFIGFHLGYFAAFVIGLLRYYLHQQPTIWFDLTVMSFPLVVGYMGARLVPYNLWQAYDRLNLSDGEIFFFFVVFGPLWGFLFLEIYPYLLNPIFGALIFLLAITTLIILMAWQYRRIGNTVIPFYWWIIFFGFVLACQVAVLFIK